MQTVANNSRQFRAPDVTTRQTSYHKVHTVLSVAHDVCNTHLVSSEYALQVDLLQEWKDRQGSGSLILVQVGKDARPLWPS